MGTSTARLFCSVSPVSSHSGTSGHKSVYMQRARSRFRSPAVPPSEFVRAEPRRVRGDRGVRQAVIETMIDRIGEFVDQAASASATCRSSPSTTGSRPGPRSSAADRRGSATGRYPADARSTYHRRGTGSGSLTWTTSMASWSRLRLPTGATLRSRLSGGWSLSRATTWPVTTTGSPAPASRAGTYT